jgi:hypothetical protein
MFDKEKQKGSFSDVVFGMAEKGMAGYVLSQLATTSANQILFPYMQAKHFILKEADKFWLSKLKSSGRVFEIKGKMVEKLKPVDIPKEADIEVESDVATPKDWMERGTIAGLVEEHLDEDSILSEIFKISDTQGVKRRKTIDRMKKHPLIQNAELIGACYTQADYLETRQDYRQARIFRLAAQSLEAQMGAPPAGQARPEEFNRAEASRMAGAPKARQRVNPSVAPPESRSGFSPAQLRQSIGTGTVGG